MADLSFTELIPDDVTPEAIEERVYDRIRTRWPEWNPSAGQLEVHQIEGQSAATADLYEVVTDVAAEIFAFYGQSILNVPRRDGLHATADSTWTIAGTHTIPAGTVVGIANGLDSVTFEVMEATEITDTGVVPLRAVEPGTSGNDLNGAVTLIDTLAFVYGITLNAPSAGGVDEETMSEYLPRLVETLQLMSPRPILPRHFEVLARQYGAFRAVALEGLDPEDESENNPLTMTVAVMDAEGQPLEAGTSTAFGTKNFIRAQITAQLMVNSNVFIIDPDYTEIDVAATIVSLDGYDHATVTAAVEAALTDYLTPINWGRREGFGQQPTTWVNTTTVRYLELAEVINRVPGVDYIYTLTLNADGDSPDTENVEIEGYVPLTQPGTITVD